MYKLDQIRLSIVGLGYVGLPLAVAFGKKRCVIGFDIDAKRVVELQSGQDHTLEVEPGELKQASYLSFTTDPALQGESNVFIVTVPTPIDGHKRPDLTRPTVCMPATALCSTMNPRCAARPLSLARLAVPCRASRPAYQIASASATLTPEATAGMPRTTSKIQWPIRQREQAEDSVMAAGVAYSVRDLSGAAAKVKVGWPPGIPSSTMDENGAALGK